MGEVKSNLFAFKTAQAVHMQNNGVVYGFSQFGYTGGGNFKCSNTDMPGARFGWNPLGCESLRYNYESRVQNGSGGKLPGFEVVAQAPSDQGRQYLYVGCDGAGADFYGFTSGDVWRLRQGGNAEHCRNILDFCPSHAGSARCTGTRMAASTTFETPPQCAEIASVIKGEKGDKGDTGAAGSSSGGGGGGGGGTPTQTIQVVYQPSGVFNIGHAQVVCGGHTGWITHFGVGSYTATTYTDAASHCMGNSFSISVYWRCNVGDSISTITLCNGSAFTNGACICTK